MAAGTVTFTSVEGAAQELLLEGTFAQTQSLSLVVAAGETYTLPLTLSDLGDQTPIPMTADTFLLLDRLAALPYLRSVRADRLAALADQTICRTFPAQTLIFGQDEPASGLWIIERGTVKIFRLSPDGREFILRIVGPGDSFNDIPALDGLSNAASVIALSRVTAWMVPGDLIVEELRADPAVALDVVGILTHRVRELVQQVEDLALCSVATRLARFLIKQLDDATLSSASITRTTIAAHLATTPESISRALRTLEDIGAIQADRHDVIVIREDLLRSVAMA